MDIIVLDFGSHTFRAGYAHSFPTDEEPRVQWPSAVEDYSGTAVWGGPPDVTQPAIISPIQQGDVTDMSALESLIHHSFYDSLGWEIGQEGSVMVAEPLLVKKRTREILSQLFFEVFNVNELFMQDHASLSLYTLGKLTGCVVDLGHGKIDVATVTDGQTNVSCVRRMDYACGDMTEGLGHLLCQSDSKLGGLTQSQLEGLKEACTAVASSQEVYEAQHSSNTLLPDDQKTIWELPDGQRVTTANEGYKLGEAVFRPALLQPILPPAASARVRAWSEGPGLTEVVAECLGSTAQLDLINKRAGHAKDVFVCGGGSLIPGISARLIHELKQTCPSEPTPAACTIPEYLPASHASLHSAWLGGAVLGRVIAGQGHWVTRWDYDECGPSVVARKCA